MASTLNNESGEKAATCSRQGWHVARLFAYLERASEVARQRRALLRLGDMALKDFGASRADAWHEGSRPWWDLPKDC
jgi:uncharacterized protein YjiS (DUF1127 family)